MQKCALIKNGWDCAHGSNNDDNNNTISNDNDNDYDDDDGGMASHPKPASATIYVHNY